MDNDNAPTGHNTHFIGQNIPNKSSILGNFQAAPRGDVVAACYSVAKLILRRVFLLCKALMFNTLQDIITL